MPMKEAQIYGVSCPDSHMNQGKWQLFSADIIAGRMAGYVTRRCDGGSGAIVMGGGGTAYSQAPIPRKAVVPSPFHVIFVTSQKNRASRMSKISLEFFAIMGRSAHDEEIAASGWIAGIRALRA